MAQNHDIEIIHQQEDIIDFAYKLLYVVYSTINTWHSSYESAYPVGIYKVSLQSISHPTIQNFGNSSSERTPECQHDYLVVPHAMVDMSLKWATKLIYTGYNKLYSVETYTFNAASPELGHMCIIIYWYYPMDCHQPTSGQSMLLLWHQSTVWPNQVLTSAEPNTRASVDWLL